MTPNETLRYAFLVYPSISPNKVRVYDHLFLVIGNGFEWDEKTGTLCQERFFRDEDGEGCFELETRSFEVALKDGLEEKRLRDQERQPERDKINAMLENLGIASKEYEEEEFTEEEIATLIQSDLDPSVLEGSYNLYPGCLEYSRLHQFPATIPPEWKVAVEEFARFVLSVPTTEANYSVARAALDRLQLISQ